MFNHNKKPTSQAPVIASSFALGFIVLCLVVYILNVASGIMIPFVIAVFLWYLINAFARILSKIRIKDFVIPRFFCFLFAILFLGVGLWFISNLITRNIYEVAAAAPNYQRNFEQMLPQIFEMFHIEREATINELFDYINLTTIVTGMLKMLTGLAGTTLVVMFYTGFLLYEQRFFNRKIIGVFDTPDMEERIRHILKNIDIQMQRYIAVKVVISTSTGLLTWLILKYFGVDFAEFWGLMAFFLNFIPYIGSLMAIVLPSMITLVQFGDMSTFVMVVLSLGVMQITLGSIIDPRLLGDSLNLSPIMIIFSLAAWGMIWGIPGMFLSIPILAMITITLGQFPATRPIAILLTKTGEIAQEDDTPADKAKSSE